MKRHWSVDEARLRREDPAAYRRWRIEQRVNVGIGPAKLKRDELKRLWPVLNLDPDRKQYLERLLWPSQS